MEQDWIPVILKKTVKKTNVIKEKKDNSENIRLNKLENENDILPQIYVPQEIINNIVTTRCNLKLSQIDFAKYIEVRPEIIIAIEKGKALYNNEIKNIIKKINKKLEIKLKKK